jgi:GxxExxY protein
MLLENLTKQVIGCAIEVHRTLGPGLLESTYQACLMHELQQNRITATKEICLPILYKGLHIQSGYRIDILVEENLILELKSVDTILPIHEAQLLTYLKLSKLKVGLLFNFNSQILYRNIKRMML